VKGLLIQLLVTEAISVFVFGFIKGYWLLGILAPVWVLALPIALIHSPDDPVGRHMYVPLVLILLAIVVVGFSISGRLAHIWGHLALFFVNVFSTVLIFALE
jgi:hypothetical protein